MSKPVAPPDDIVDGYMDGWVDDRDELPAESNRSEEYQFGWRNGRDDRRRSPRATAQQLREELAELRRTAGAA